MRDQDRLEKRQKKVRVGFNDVSVKVTKDRPIRLSLLFVYRIAVDPRSEQLPINARRHSTESKQEEILQNLAQPLDALLHSLLTLPTCRSCYNTFKC